MPRKGTLIAEIVVCAALLVSIIVVFVPFVSPIRQRQFPVRVVLAQTNAPVSLVSFKNRVVAREFDPKEFCRKLAGFPDSFMNVLPEIPVEVTNSAELAGCVTIHLSLVDAEGVVINTYSGLMPQLASDSGTLVFKRWIPASEFYGAERIVIELGWISYDSHVLPTFDKGHE